MSFTMFAAHASLEYMTIELQDGSKFSFLLNDKPVVTISDDDLIVNGNEETSYAISNVKNFHFTEGDLTDVSNSAASEMSIFNVDGIIKIQNAPVAANVNVINVNGVLLSSSTVNSEGEATIALPNSKGVYVVTVGNNSFKVIRK